MAAKGFATSLAHAGLSHSDEDLHVTQSGRVAESATNGQFERASSGAPRKPRFVLIPQHIRRLPARSQAERVTKALRTRSPVGVSAPAKTHFAAHRRGRYAMLRNQQQTTNSSEGPSERRANGRFLLIPQHRALNGSSRARGSRSRDTAGVTRRRNESAAVVEGRFGRGAGAPRRCWR